MSDQARKIRALSAFQEIADEANVESGHGVKHAALVMQHCSRAVALCGDASSTDVLAVELAGALHDADDRKLFPNSVHGEYANALLILERVFPAYDYGKELHDLVIRLIGYVSCSTNGNSIPDDTADLGSWWNYPRLSDRSEAIGGIGVLRAYSYTIHIGNPLFTTETPRVTNQDELDAVATPERFAQYLITKRSDSFIDHFYDKLMHICQFDDYTTNSYLLELSRSRTAEMKQFLFSFGKDPTDLNVRRWITKFKSSYILSV